MRARNIKPGFWENEVLSELPYGARLMFIGLWCLADREGRLEDRPKRIKGQLFRWDQGDVEPWLQGLATMGFIHRYKVESMAYIQIRNFGKHQRPHQNESKSIIPEALRETCNHGTKDLLPRTKALRSDSLIPDSLIPDPGYLIPDSDIPPSFSNNEKEGGMPRLGNRASASELLPTTKENDNGAVKVEIVAPLGPKPEELMMLWNARAHPSLPRVKLLTETRKKHVKARLAENSEKRFWEELIDRINASPLLTGQMNGQGHEKWICNFDWVMNSQNLVKILEGNYDKRR